MLMCRPESCMKLLNEVHYYMGNKSNQIEIYTTKVVDRSSNGKTSLQITIHKEQKSSNKYIYKYLHK